MQSSIHLSSDLHVQYLLRIGDSCLLLSQRLCEWCGHAPMLEEDIAMANIGLDLLGQARAVLTRAGQLDGQGFDEDQLAFLRDERDYVNPTLVELPRGDFAFTVLRIAMVSTLMKLLWDQLQASSDRELSAIAGKAIKEAVYHQRHAADWVVRLGDGTAESHRRCEDALAQLWRYTPELFESDAVNDAAAAAGLGPSWSTLREPWLAEMNEILKDATLQVPKDSAFRSRGMGGVHSEHMGYLLADMQYLQRAFPGGVW